MSVDSVSSLFSRESVLEASGWSGGGGEVGGESLKRVRLQTLL